ncbi:MAG: aminotransferase class I/II-fold pyridoxal phosphate-dependent enzyme, partial [Alphaproteobacteria bacterium]|nr:aminotransferase class I/II-fold pyridoxal phosphate-dependent enzyme [Alphaproteobacteria bacterium]
MPERRLPAGGANVFQRIRQRRAEAEARGGKLLDLSIGEPRGAALLSARQAAAAAVLSDDEAMHTYQYNASAAVPDFSARFVAAHLKCDLDGLAVDYLPIPGIKPMLGLLPLACGCAEGEITVATMSRPGFPIPANWCQYHPKVTHQALPLHTANRFRFAIGEIVPTADLVMMNYPHNPSGQVASRAWLAEVCRHCSQHDIRLFNDAAYLALGHTDESSSLAEAAVD